MPDSPDAETGATTDEEVMRDLRNLIWKGRSARIEFFDPYRLPARTAREYGMHGGCCPHLDGDCPCQRAD
jgi:hypothetical protein